MSRRDKVLLQWLKAKEELFETVDSVLSHYGFSLVSRTGSHCTYAHPKLIEAYQRFKNVDDDLKKRFGSEGLLTVPIRGGQKVAGVYLRNILAAIEIISREENDDG